MDKNDKHGVKALIEGFQLSNVRFGEKGISAVVEFVGKIDGVLCEVRIPVAVEGYRNAFPRLLEAVREACEPYIVAENLESVDKEHNQRIAPAIGDVEH